MRDRNHLAIRRFSRLLLSHHQAVQVGFRVQDSLKGLFVLIFGDGGLIEVDVPLEQGGPFIEVIAIELCDLELF